MYSTERAARVDVPVPAIGNCITDGSHFVMHSRCPLYLNLDELQLGPCDGLFLAKPLTALPMQIRANRYNIDLPFGQEERKR
jgi:hypothetical protein